MTPVMALASIVRVDFFVRPSSVQATVVSFVYPTSLSNSIEFPPFFHIIVGSFVPSKAHSRVSGLMIFASNAVNTENNIDIIYDIKDRSTIYY